MGDLGVVPTWIPLLLSAPSGTSVQSERAGTGDCNLSEDHPGSETVKCYNKVVTEVANKI